MKTHAPTSLRCEYFVDPLGLDCPRPGFTWMLDDPQRGARQTAYQIVVASSATLLEHDQGNVWDSGKVESDRSIHVVYEGPELVSRRRYHWKVRTWDRAGRTGAYSAPAFFEMGLLARSDWSAKWIASSLAGSKRTSVPCPYLRRAFDLAAPIASARVYVTALGLYELYVNGKRVGSDVLTPGWTNFRKRCYYQAYDVTELVTPGRNAIGAILGDGWYCGHVGAEGRQQYGNRPKLLAQLVVEHVNGTTSTVVTDGSWRVAFGPLIASDLIMGEAYDARLELGDWCSPDYDDRAWSSAIEQEDPGISIEASPGPPVRRLGELAVVKKPVLLGKTWNQREFVFDLGQNMVGRVRLRVKGAGGHTLRIRHAEMLNEDGSLYTAALRGASATDYFTPKSDDETVYEPHFTFHGFRYVEVTGHPGELDAEAVTGIVLHSDTPETGSFECSDLLVNQLQRNITWGQKGNFLEVPTDCPQRDERLGWTGDAQVFVRTAAFNMDVAAFFTKWQQDLADDQTENGDFPNVAPNASPFGFGSPAWADAAVICPYTIFLCYGDERLLARHYESLTRFIRHLALSNPDFIRSHPARDAWGGFGDWLSTKAETPKDLIGTAFFAYSAGLLARIARVLGKADDAAKLEQLRQNVRKAFLRRFVTPDGLVAGLTQTGYTLALYFDLLPEEQRSTAVAEIVRDVRSRGMHLSTGFVGTPYLPHVLGNGGALDVAYALLQQKSWPSWLYPVTHGATTIWERWDGWTEDKGFQDAGMNSFNHYAYGAVGAWLYATVAGIDIDPDRPAYKHVIVRPRPGGGLTFARARLRTMFGVVESSWRIEGTKLVLDVAIPWNTTATVHVPARGNVMEGDRPASDSPGVKSVGRTADAEVFEVEAGRYAFTASLEG
jgi:alpha-L-rhamnosidase